MSRYEIKFYHKIHSGSTHKNSYQSNKITNLLVQHSKIVWYDVMFQSTQKLNVTAIKKFSCHKTSK